jgi:hypothetical protein
MIHGPSILFFRFASGTYAKRSLKIKQKAVEVTMVRVNDSNFAIVLIFKTSLIEQVNNDLQLTNAGASQLRIQVLASKSLPVRRKPHHVDAIEFSKSHNGKVLSLALSSNSTFSARLRSFMAFGRQYHKARDSMNDSLAQSVADVGVLFSLSRACIAAVADMTIMSSDLRCLPKLLNIARATMVQARYNITCAMVYNIMSISLVMGVGER